MVRTAAATRSCCEPASRPTRFCPSTVNPTQTPRPTIDTLGMQGKGNSKGKWHGRKKFFS